MSAKKNDWFYVLDSYKQLCVHLRLFVGVISIIVDALELYLKALCFSNYVGQKFIGLCFRVHTFMRVREHRASPEQLQLRKKMVHL